MGLKRTEAPWARLWWQAGSGFQALQHGRRHCEFFAANMSPRIDFGALE
jgi:hypothetical protein